MVHAHADAPWRADRRLAARMPRGRAEDAMIARDDRAEQRQEDDRRYMPPQPFIMLMSSTAIEPRLR